MLAINYLDGEWIEGNPPILGPMTHATWMASAVFDGARAFAGVAPDLDLHCARVVKSACSLGMKPMLSAGEIMEIAREGIARFPAGAELYVRPMFWPESGHPKLFVAPDPDSTRFCLTVHEVPLPKPGPLSICLSSLRRPSPSMAPTMAKASCLYPNSGRAIVEANEKGFDNAVMLDGNDNVAELASANIWIGKNNTAHTPAANGTFLSGITRERVAKLLRGAGIEVHERAMTFTDIMEADEVFTTGNLAKVLPVTRVEDRDLQPGPVYTKAREMYFDWALKG